MAVFSRRWGLLTRGRLCQSALRLLIDQAVPFVTATTHATPYRIAHSQWLAPFVESIDAVGIRSHGGTEGAKKSRCNAAW